MSIEEKNGGTYLVSICSHAKKNLNLSKNFNLIFEKQLVNIVMAPLNYSLVIRLLYKLLKFLNIKSHDYSKFQRVDYLFFNSANKKSYGPLMDYISKKLLSSNKSVGIVSNDNFKIYFKDQEIELSKEYNRIFNHKESVLSFFIEIFYSLFISVKFLLNFYNSLELFTFFLKRLPSIVTYIFLSRHRSKTSVKFLETLNSKFIFLHNEKIPVANELIMAGKKAKAKVICLFSEHPNELVLPIESDTVWVWDQYIKDELINLSKLNNSAIPNIEIIGHYESEIIIKNRPKINKNLNSYLYPNFEKIFIFISEFTTANTWVTREKNNACLNIIQKAADQFPDWLFIIKKRDHNDGNKNDYFKNNSFLNIKFIEGRNNNKTQSEDHNDRLDLEDLLADDRTKATGAISSLGLYTALMTGVPSCVFKLNKSDKDYFFLNNYCSVIRNYSDFEEYIKSTKHKKEELLYKLGVSQLRYNPSRFVKENLEKII